MEFQGESAHLIGRFERRQEKATFRQGWSEFGPRAFAAITLEDI
jgi:hypothetical protein